MSCCRLPSAPGFTLIELLAATALSALLMLGVLTVIGDLGAASLSTGDVLQEGASQDNTGSRVLDASSLDAWVRLLRDDLEHAASVDATANRLTLASHSALDARGRNRTHRPTEVSYEIERRAGRSWVVRRQAALDLLTNQHVQRDLVCAGVVRFELVPQQIAWPAADPAPGTAAVTPAPSVRNLAAIPDTAPTPAALNAPDTTTPAIETGSAQDEPGQSDERPSILYKGLLFYPEYLPAGAMRELSQAVDSSGERNLKSPPPTEIPSGESAEPGAGQVSTDAVPSVTSAATWAGTTLWRLRIWTDDSNKPTHDRVVTVREQP